MSSNDTIKIFIGYDANESVAYHTLVASIMRRATRPTSITPISMQTLGHIIDRPRDPKQSNDFAFIRFLVPWLCNFEGRAIFMDCDMMLRADIGELWDLFDPKFSVQVVKHDYEVAEGVKYLGTPQTPYDRKNWSSVMLFNCSACRPLQPEYINRADGLDLHQFLWLHSKSIGELPKEWNHLVGVYEPYGSSPIDLLCNFEGRAIFMDCDMMLRADIGELWDLFDPKFSVQVVKHDYEVAEGVKYLGTPQTPYDRKNWSSVMLFNCSACRPLQPEYINRADGLDLHQFLWLHSKSIGELPKEWNHLVGVYEPYGEVKLVHWTEGGPYFHDYACAPYADEWLRENQAMEHCSQLAPEPAV